MALLQKCRRGAEFGAMAKCTVQKGEQTSVPLRSAEGEASTAWRCCRMQKESEARCCRKAHSAKGGQDPMPNAKRSRRSRHALHPLTFSPCPPYAPNPPPPLKTKPCTSKRCHPTSLSATLTPRPPLCSYPPPTAPKLSLPPPPPTPLSISYQFLSIWRCSGLCCARGDPIASPLTPLNIRPLRFSFPVRGAQ